ncbi:MAG: hypothetical protein IKJ24_05055 [Clostridia bacterium]|nr:hypothetical protein [Clostridia bacterium]
MKIAIIYTTTGGTTRECGELLARELSGQDVTLFDMDERHDLSDYDVAVIGFPIRMARPARRAKRYIKEHKGELLTIKSAYYMCCGFIDFADEYARQALPCELYESALDITCLGGSLDPARFKGFDKLIVKSVRSEILGGGNNGDQRDDMALPTILDENISQLADLIKKSV